MQITVRTIIGDKEKISAAVDILLSGVKKLKRLMKKTLSSTLDLRNTQVEKFNDDERSSFFN